MSKKVDLSGTTVNFYDNSVNLLRKLSETLYCQVYMTDQNSIIKFIDISKVECRDYYSREIPAYQIMSPHPNLAGYIDHIMINSHLFLHLEYYPKGDYNYIMAMSRISYSDIREVIIDVCMALDDLHSKSIYHMDIRAENILLSNEGVSKLCDFGSSLRPDLLIYLHENALFGEFISKFTYTPIRPPELQGNFPVSVGSWTDMWQVGCLLYTMINYQPPFPYGFNEMIDLKEAPKLFRGILEGLLQVNPDKRFQAREVIELLLPTPILGGVLAERRVTLIEKIAARSTKQLINRIISDNDSFSTQSIERIVYKALKKPVKISKFMSILEEKISRTVAQSAKTLHLLHVYLYKIPYVLEKYNTKLQKMLSSFAVYWNLKSAERNQSPYSKFFACFIKQYSKLLMKKIELYNNYGIECNWSKVVVNENSIKDILVYLEFCIYIVMGLSMNTINELSKIRSEIVKTINAEISMAVLATSRFIPDMPGVWYNRFKDLHKQINSFSEKKNFGIFLVTLPEMNHQRHYKYHLPTSSSQSLNTVKSLQTYSNLID